MADLPAGTPTFLFTDLEGSSRLWEEQPHAMRLALARHDVLLRAAIETNGGTVFKTVGDAFCAAFRTAPEALRAALEVQQSLLSQQPSAVAASSGLVLKVRIAVHSGSAELRDGDYFGPALNRVARLLALAHGGQSLVSEAAHSLVRDDLPAGVLLGDLGVHGLRDLARPERVYQLNHPDLPNRFPSLRSFDRPRTNLPVQATSFVGREKEMAEVRELLEGHRLLTLTGSGGTGKTRLLLQVAADVAEEYPEGVWLVELAPLADPALVPQAVAGALGLREEPARRLEETVTDFLRERKLLLLLDNCEHLLSAAATLTDAVLRACPGVRLIASSREALGIAGEQTYRVPSLSLPSTGPVPPEALSQYEAVRLFIERTLLSDPRFRVTNANAPAVAQLCHRLDGIPLAIELAAARVKALSVEKLAERLDDRFRLLTGGSRTALPRQQTLRAAIDWSYALLDEQEKTLLRRLSVFAGGWTLEAAEKVCSDDAVIGLKEAAAGDACLSATSASAAMVSEFEVLDLLTRLVEKSLVAYDEDDQGDGRYRLLETVRQYARDRLVDAGAGAGVRGRHLAYFVSFIEQGVSETVAACWDRLERDYDNIRSALVWAKDTPGQLALVVRMVGPLERFWQSRASPSEMQHHLQELLMREDAAAWDVARLHLLSAAATAARVCGDYATAQAHLQEQVEVARHLGELEAWAIALHSLGLVAIERSDLGTARTRFEEAMEVDRERGWKGGWAPVMLGRTLVELGLLDDAETVLKQSRAALQEVGDRAGLAQCLAALGRTAEKRGDRDRAVADFRSGLMIFHEFGARPGVASVLRELARLALPDRQRAVRLLGAEAAVREEERWHLAPGIRSWVDALLAESRAALGDQTFADAWAHGNSMTFDEAVGYALLASP